MDLCVKTAQKLTMSKVYSDNPCGYKEAPPYFYRQQLHNFTEKKCQSGKLKEVYTCNAGDCWDLSGCGFISIACDQKSIDNYLYSLSHRGFNPFLIPCYIVFLLIALWFYVSLYSIFKK